MSLVLQIGAPEKDAIVLDSFAGSGTTGHAVLAVNKIDGGTRRFILVEMDEAICRDVTAQRIRKAIEGYGETPGLGGGFRFCKLGAPLFDDAGSIGGEVRFTDLAEAHVYFTETGEPIPKRASKSPLLGVHNGRAIYLLFNGVFGDLRPDGGNVLTGITLAALPLAQRATNRVRRRLSWLSAPRLLKREGVVFKQVPYGIKVT